MKTPSNDGGPAFPQHGWTNNPEVLERMKNQGGMTLRDYFAGQAMAQLIKREVREIRKDGRKMDCFGLDDSPEVPWHTSHIASESYAIADAMLAARERKEDAP
jgi:hypothetical protein